MDVKENIEVVPTGTSDDTSIPESLRRYKEGQKPVEQTSDEADQEGQT